jgi:hypothetical protein
VCGLPYACKPTVCLLVWLLPCAGVLQLQADYKLSNAVIDQIAAKLCASAAASCSCPAALQHEWDNAVSATAAGLHKRLHTELEVEVWIAVLPCKSGSHDLGSMMRFPCITLVSQLGPIVQQHVCSIDLRTIPQFGAAYDDASMESMWTFVVRSLVACIVALMMNPDVVGHDGEFLDFDGVAEAELSGSIGLKQQRAAAGLHPQQKIVSLMFFLDGAGVGATMLRSWKPLMVTASQFRRHARAKDNAGELVGCVPCFAFVRFLHVSVVPAEHVCAAWRRHAALRRHRIHVVTSCLHVALQVCAQLPTQGTRHG